LILAIIIYISSSSKVTRKEGVVLLSLYISYIYMSLI
jgi:Ca2+/Na+ antiporter